MHSLRIQLIHAWTIFLLIVGAYANSQFSNYVVHESRSSAPDGFLHLSTAPGNQTLDLRIALANSNITGLEEMLYAVSTPGNSLYGQHLSKEEVEEYVRPTNETTSIVGQFLLANNISAKTVSPAGDWLAFSIPVSQANNLFGANYSVFKHEATGSQITRTLSYSIPVELQGHLELVHPSISFDVLASQPSINTTRLSSPSKLVTRQTSSESCDDEVTPACLQCLYSIPTTLATQSTNRIGIASLENEAASIADFQSYLSEFRPDLMGFTFDLFTVDGGTNSQTEPSIGANAITQVAAGLASKVPMTFIVAGTETKDGSLDGFLDIANALLEQSSPPQVLSISFLENENEISSTLANQLCNAFMQLGVRGVSVLVASGDGGVAGADDQNDSCTEFIPTFPSDCPFVTSVGATNNFPETASSFSSGGFSNIFSRPSYQSSSVAKYISLIGSENAGRFNSSGRGFPDVSASGMNIPIVFERQLGTVAGTVVATPIFAGVIALLNDDLISQGRPPMGFLNPFLYNIALEEPIVNDITSGNNPGCSTNGFTAVPGWDPVSGLGTPNFPSLQDSIGA